MQKIFLINLKVYQNQKPFFLNKKFNKNYKGENFEKNKKINKKLILFPNKREK